MIAMATPFLFHGLMNIFISALHSTPLHRLALWQNCPDQLTKASKYVANTGAFVSTWTSSPAQSTKLTSADPPVHNLSLFALEEFYMHVAWSNYGLNVLNIAQTYQGDLAYMCKD